ncbi:hypothetical protein D9M68_501380 [compost metagenome]
MVGVDHRRECRPAPPVTAEQVLDDLLAALVLEVDVDIRRLVALLRHEALEQEFGEDTGVQLGDAQGEAHHRVGRRAAPLAKDALATGEIDDVVHREEVALVAQLGDQRELLFHQRSRLGRHAAGPASQQSLLGDGAQPGAGAVPVRHQLAGVLVIQLVQAELAATGNAHRFGHQLRRVEAGQQLTAAQVALAIGEQAEPGLGYRAVMAHGGHAVLQGAAATGMHMHIAGRHGRDADTRGQGQQARQTAGVVRPLVQFHRQPQAFGEALAQPGAFAVVVFPVRHPEGQQALRGLGQVLAQQAVLALLRTPPGLGDEPAKALVAGQILRQQHQLRTALDPHFAADHQGHSGVFGGLPGADDAGQGAFVGDRQRRVAMFPGPLEQFAGTGGAALEAEIGQAVQLGVGVHANQPCNSSGPSPCTGRKAQPRWPPRVSTR